MSEWEPLANGQTTLKDFGIKEPKPEKKPKKIRKKSKPGNDFYKIRIVVTRKVHKCYDCWKDIEKGSRVYYAIAVDAGRFLHGHFCNDCRDLEKDGEGRTS